MKQEIKEKWLSALRSGEWKQIQGRLGYPANKKACCLGVLCVVAGLNRGTVHIVSGVYEGFEHTLAPADRETVGLSNAEHDRLWGMNDTELKSFVEIADWIEVNL